MEPNKFSATPETKPLRIVAWVLSILLGLAFLANAAMKFTGGADAMLGALGVPLAMIPVIAAIEAIGAILLVVPATRFLGGALLAGTMAGAVATHLLAADFTGWIGAAVFGVLVGLVAWWTRPVWVQQRIGGVTV